MKTLQAIIFDKDGTLFDERKTLAGWARTVLLDLAGDEMGLARRMGASVGFDIDAMVFDHASVLLQNAPGLIAERLLVSLPGATSSGIATRLAAASVDVVPVEATPLVPLLSELKNRNLRLGLATNDTSETARAHLATVGAEDAFARIVGSDHGFTPKPAPDMLCAIMDDLELSPRACLMVGDSRHDMAAARAAGMHCVGVLSGESQRGQLAGHADDVIPSIAALPAWLDRAAAGQNAA